MDARSLSTIWISLTFYYMYKLNRLSDSALKYTSVYILSEHTDTSIDLSDSLLTTHMFRFLIVLAAQRVWAREHV